ESLPLAADPAVSYEHESIPSGSSRRRLAGHLGHAVIDQVLDHQTAALVRPLREPALRQLGQLWSRELLPGEVSPEFVRVVRVIGLRGRGPIRRGRGDGLD